VIFYLKTAGTGQHIRFFYKIPLDSDYVTICVQLKSASTTLEEQFQSNSGKWWLNDFQKWFPNQDPIGLEGQVKRARNLIAKLNKSF